MLDAPLVFNADGVFPSANDSPLVIDLAACGYVPGDRLILQQLGEFSYNGIDADTLTAMGAVFSASDVVTDPTDAQRVHGAIACNGAPIFTPPTFHGGLPTDIPQDFLVDGATEIIVPTGALYLIAAASDVFYGDNTDTDNDYAIRITRVGGCNDIDFNNDGVFPETEDIADFLTVFSGGVPDCTNTPNGCDTIDFNNDGVFPSSDDIEAFLRVFGGGDC